jgi:HSP20 family protein
MITFFDNFERGRDSGPMGIWREFDRLMRDADKSWPQLSRSTSFQPAFAEREDRYELVVPAPAMAPKDVELQVHGGVLSLRAAAKQTVPEGYRATHLERGSYEYSRSFRLPTNADPNEVSASLVDGVLTVKVAKIPQTKPKLIPVTAA